MTEFNPALVERLRVLLFGNATFGTDTAVEAIRVRAALRALPIPAAALNALEAGEAVVVPVEATEEMGVAFWPSLQTERQRCPARTWAAMLAASPYDKETKDG